LIVVYAEDFIVSASAFRQNGTYAHNDYEIYPARGAFLHRSACFCIFRNAVASDKEERRDARSIQFPPFQP
jgi:hypothetical protein